MKEAVFSVPKGTFPGSVGDSVRVSLKKIVGLDTIETWVVSVQKGCGVSDRVVLRYDETMLPYGVKALLACSVSGFVKQCDCCQVKICQEVVAPNSDIDEGTQHIMVMPGDFRLDEVKFYSPNPAQEPLLLQLFSGGLKVFPMPVEMCEESLTVKRVAFNGDFDSGLISQGDSVELSILSAPSYAVYYGDPWKGLIVCLNGEWLPHSKTKHPVIRTPGVKPPSSGGGSYPAGWVDRGDGIPVVVDDSGTFVIQ